MPRLSAVLGNLLADLTVGVVALLTENETGELLKQRKTELLTTLYAMVRHIENL